MWIRSQFCNTAGGRSERNTADKMSANFSSSSNDSLPHPNLFSISFISLFLKCYTTRPSSFIYISYRITYVLLVLPLCIFIIYHGLQQRRKNGSTSSSATMSHSDSFTYHMVTMEMIAVCGSVLMICGFYRDDLILMLVGFFLFAFAWFGQMFFHVLTCVERYLAVVHPITYLSLRKERGIRIRNISITCVWLLCFVGISLLMTDDYFNIIHLCVLILSVAVVFVCSVSVLCVLIRPGPGEQVGVRERVDQSKQRAFYTIMAILGVLVVRIACNLVWAVLNVVEGGADCMIVTSSMWFFLPSSLVLPLLFLHRAGKLVCWKKTSSEAKD